MAAYVPERRQEWERRVPPVQTWPALPRLAFLFGPPVVLALAVLLVNPLVLLASVTGMAAALASIANPFIGVLGYLWCEYLRPMARIEALSALHLPRLIAGCALLGWLLRRPTYFRARENAIMAAMLGVILVTAPFAYWKSRALVAAADFAKTFAMFLLIVNTTDSPRRLRTLVWTLILLGGFLSIEQLLAYRASAAGALVRVGSRSGGFLGEDGDFALALLVLLPFPWFLAGRDPSRALRVAAAGMVALFTCSIVATGSRGAAVGLLAELSIFWMLSRRKLLALLIAAVVAGSWWTFSPEAYRQRMLTISIHPSDEAALQRTKAWQAALRMFSGQPLFGVGAENFYYAFTGQYGGSYHSDRTVHNLYLQAAAELGILGLACLLALIAAVFWRARDARRLLAAAGRSKEWDYGVGLALSASLIGFMIHAALQTPLYYPHLYLLAAIAAATGRLARDSGEAT